MFMESSNTPHNRQTNKKLVKIIHALLENEQSTAFRKPVPHKALGLGDYKKIVKKPIDLNQIRRQNNDQRYKTIQQAFDDIQLCWNNCKIYNHASSQVYQQALALQKLFWKLIQDNFPQIYSAAENKINEIKDNQINNHGNTTHSKQLKNHQPIYQPSQEELPMKDQIDDNSDNKNGEGDGEQSRNSKMEQQNIDSGNQQNNDIRSQKSQIKQQAKQPIQVCLKQKPTIQNIIKLTNYMKWIQDKSVLQQVLQLLFLHQKQNIITNTKGQIHFKINNIHLSTFYRICKIIKLQLQDSLQIIQ